MAGLDGHPCGSIWRWHVLNPEKVLRQLDNPILEPQEPYEKEGLRPGTVFSCGSVVWDDQLLVYYGAADQVVAVASGSFKKLLQALKNAPSGQKY